MDTALHHPNISQLCEKAKKKISHDVAWNKDLFVRNFLGILTRRNFIDCKEPHSLGESVVNNLEMPIFDNEYFEWLEIIDAVLQAEKEFIMLELGAGFGRWCVKAHHILQLLNPMPSHFFAVEAEPSHFQWLQQHFLDNDIPKDRYTLVEAAIAPTKRLTRFSTGEADAWYGQNIENNSPKIREWLSYALEKFLKWSHHEKKSRSHKIVNTVTLSSILEKVPHVDIIDLDIQGAELEVLPDVIQLLNQKVKRVFISTHGSHIEIILYHLFKQHAWINTRHYQLHNENETPYGKIKFIDGVQCWLNPAFIRN